MAKKWDYAFDKLSGGSGGTFLSAESGGWEAASTRRLESLHYG